MELGNLVEERLSERASYRRFESGIHEITFHEPSRYAADKFLEHLSYVFDQHLETNEPYFLLIDAGENVQIPLRYVFQRGRELNRTKYPTVPQGGRSVYVFQKTFLVTVLDAFLRIARPQVSRRYLEPHQKQEAVDWLLEGIEERQKERDAEEVKHARNVALFTTDLPKAPKRTSPKNDDESETTSNYASLAKSEKASTEKASDDAQSAPEASGDTTSEDSAFTETSEATAETVKNETIATDTAYTQEKSKPNATPVDTSENSSDNKKPAAD